jgi:hypothetical protein
MASVRIGDERVTVVNVHASPITVSGFGPEDHAAVCRRSLTKAYRATRKGYAMDFLACLSRAVVTGREPFIVGGDWNVARHMDNMPPLKGGGPDARDFFERLERWGWCEVVPSHAGRVAEQGDAQPQVRVLKFNHNEIATFPSVPDHREPYQNDHVHVDPGLHQHTSAYVHDEDKVRALSDHLPLVVCVSGNPINSGRA